jgi:hypothetical protein
MRQLWRKAMKAGESREMAVANIGWHRYCGVKSMARHGDAKIKRRVTAARWRQRQVKQRQTPAHIGGKLARWRAATALAAWRRQRGDRQRKRAE